MAGREHTGRETSHGPTVRLQVPGPWQGRLEWLCGVQVHLWLFVVVGMLADIILTIYGLEVGLTETNPIAVAALDASGAAGLFVIKLAALGVGGLVWLLVPRRVEGIVPLGLLLPSLGAVGINLVMIALVTLA